MRILTIGDSWTYGVNSSNPATMSWPAQMARKYNVEVVNLARHGSSNQRAARIGIEEICRDSNYDYIIFPLAPAVRTELLKIGKWHQIWPASGDKHLDKIYGDFWHPWNDVQHTIMLSFYFMHSVHSLGVPLYMSGLSLYPDTYFKEMSWITDYKDDADFVRMNMPLKDLNIGISDLDRKLKSLRAIHNKNLKLQPDYLYDIFKNYLEDTSIQHVYNYTHKNFSGHPDDNGYAALADYFAKKIGLTN